MPIYEYKCDGCGIRFERNQRMSDEPVRVCPECGKESVRKILSTGGVVGSMKSPEPPPSCPTGGCAGGMCGLG